ncbi:MAG: hypothetical protein ACLTG0_06830 [Oscillibacter sp.]
MAANAFLNGKRIAAGTVLDAVKEIPRTRANARSPFWSPAAATVRGRTPR